MNLVKAERLDDSFTHERNEQWRPRVVIDWCYECGRLRKLIDTPEGRFQCLTCGKEWRP